MAARLVSSGQQNRCGASIALGRPSRWSPAMPYTSALLVVALMVALFAAACTVPPQHASITVLQGRAALELGCSPSQLVVHHLDRRTKLVTGCQRRAVYVESCEKRAHHWHCTWLLQTIVPERAHASAPSATAQPSPCTCPPQPAVGTEAEPYYPAIQPREEW